MSQLITGIFLPLLGTTLGAACVFFLKGQMHPKLQRGFSGFAAGVMVAASIWSLLIPALEHSVGTALPAFLPAVGGLWIGFLFLMLLDRLIPHLHASSNEAEGPHCSLGRSTMLSLAVALHNLPEGIAVGVALAGAQQGETQMTAALALAIGIAVQNFPEGAIVAMPLGSCGIKKGKAFTIGVLSGLVEPLGAILTVLLAGLLVPALPWLLAFAAGAMLYVVVEELIPEMAEGDHSHLGTVCFAIGFSLMMMLDVVLG